MLGKHELGYIYVIPEVQNLHTCSIITMILRLKDSLSPAWERVRVRGYLKNLFKPMYITICIGGINYY